MEKLKLKFGTLRREERGRRPEADLSGESDSSLGSMMSVTGSPARSPDRALLKRVRSSERMSSAGSLIDSDDDPDAPAIKVVAAPRRGRGRPPTTGEYVGLAKAKAALVAAEREEMQLRAEREVQEMTMSLRSQRPTSARLSESSAANSEAPASELKKTAMDCVAAINNVASKSSNLKGTYQRALKEAASTIREIVDDLQARSSTEETRILQASNARLRDEVAELRKEIVELRRDLTAVSASAPPQASGSTIRNEPQSTEELEQAILRQIGGMLNARFEALEGRLLPEQRARPPLAADNKRKVSRRDPVAPITDQGLPETSVAPEMMQPPSNARKSGKGKGKGKATKGGQPVAGPSSETSRSVPAAPTETWAKVAKRGGKKKKGGGTAPAPLQRQSQAQAGSRQTQDAASRRPAKTEKAAPKLIVPRTAAVVLTLTPRAVEAGASYAAALFEAKKQINLETLGITALDIRNTASGSRLLEVPGASRGEKADLLAAKLREVFDEGDMKISRPTKCADLRVTGLDDSIKEEEVAAAIAGVGNCGIDLIKVNGIRRNVAGIGTTFVRCPVTAAKKAADNGRLKIGWISARVKVLPARPLRCFRCLEVGHVRERCPADKADRSGECYRCGQTGHKASGCSGEAHCSVCAAAGKPASHRLGGGACAEPVKKGRKAAAKAKARKLSSGTATKRAEESQMDAG